MTRTPADKLAAIVTDLVDEEFEDFAQSHGYVPKNLYRRLAPLFVKPLVAAVLRNCKGNQVHASARLGINRNTLRKIIRAHRVSVET